MLKLLFKPFTNQIHPTKTDALAEAATKMQNTIDRHAAKQNICLFKTDYLER